MMVATQTLKRELAAHGFQHLRIWSRGVDVEQFHPIAGERLPYEGPIWLYVGRVAVEKNIEASWRSICPAPRWWWATARPGRACRAKYPDVKFLGALSGEALTKAYAGSDVFVFPSRTDTFGLVLLEALACGAPVAAYPVEGPRDVVGRSPGGPDVAVLDEDLRRACLEALEMARKPDSPDPGPSPRAIPGGPARSVPAAISRSSPTWISPAPGKG